MRAWLVVVMGAGHSSLTHLFSPPPSQVCSTCPMMLPNRCSFSAHQRMHKNRSPHVCPECGGNFLQANFQTHLREACLHFSRRVGYRCLTPLFPPVCQHFPPCTLWSNVVQPQPFRWPLQESPIPPAEALRVRAGTCSLASVCLPNPFPQSGGRAGPPLEPQLCLSRPPSGSPVSEAPSFLHRACVSLPMNFPESPQFLRECTVGKWAWRYPCLTTAPPTFLPKVPQLCSGVWGCELHQVPHPDITLRGFPQVPHLPHGLQVCTQRSRPPLHPASYLPHAAGQVRPGEGA